MKKDITLKCEIFSKVKFAQTPRKDGRGNIKKVIWPFSYQKAILAFLTDKVTMKKATKDLSSLASNFHSLIFEAIFNYVHHLIHPGSGGQKTRHVQEHCHLEPKRYLYRCLSYSHLDLDLRNKKVLV